MDSLEKLLEIMATLRDPQSGCPWDQQQDFASIAPYTVEEAYEVADAIARDDMHDLRDELGDLLFQVVFHARMAEERGAFAFADVAAAIGDKMLRRHPHVFGSPEEVARGQVKGDWQNIKAAERARKHAGASALEGVALALPALKRAEKLGKRAAGAGFDWPDASGPLAKITEELAELAAARDAGDPADIEAELGDVLFSVVNLARHLGVDPEAALSSANRKFEQRFRAVEKAVGATGQALQELSLDELEAHWQASKS
jgi:MazG family protein